MPCQTLYRSDALEVASCVGDAARRRPHSMHFPSFEAHFQTDGAYFLHEGTEARLIDVHHVELRRARSTEMYSRPIVSSDCGMSVRFSLGSLGSEWSSNDDPHGTVFPTGAVRVDWQRFRELCALRAALEQARAEPHIVDGRLSELLASLVREGWRQARRTVAGQSTIAVKHRAAVEGAKAFLIEHHHERPDLCTVAAAVDYAPHQFVRIFRAETGLSLHRYLTELRLRQAAARLECGITNLSGLALDLGFSSQSHFTTIFREYFGCTPGGYRADRGARLAR